MKHSKITGLLAVMVAATCFMQTACGKASKTKSAQKEASDTEIPPSVSETSDAASISQETTNRVVDLNLSDLQKDMATAPTDSRKEEPSEGNGKDQGSPSGENASIGALAAANDKFTYCVVHYDKSTVSIQEENNRTHEAKLVYSASPKKGIDHRIDSLLTAENYLFFRESENWVKRLDLSSYSVEDVLEGKIERLMYYDGHLYFEEDSSIRRSDLDGKNEEVLFTASKAADHIRVPFCIMGGTIYFTDPVEPCEDGFYYGKLLSMDVDGKNRQEHDIGASVGNYIPMLSDGERIIFRGSSVYDDGTPYLGFIACRPDGSDEFFYEGGSDEILYCFDGKLYKNEKNTMLAVDGYSTTFIMEGAGFEAPSTITDFAAVGDWFYVMGESSQYRTGAVTVKIYLPSNYYLYIDPS